MKFLFDIRRASLPLCFVVLSSAAWAACTGAENGDDDDSGGAAGSGTGGGSTGGAGGGGQGPNGLPCEVQSFLQTNCQSCHSTPTSGGAPMPLTSRDELLVKNNGSTYAERAISLIKTGTMPPEVTLSASAYKPLEDWVAAGTPAGECNAGAGGGGQDPLGAAPTCTSNQTALPCEPEAEDGRLPADGPGCEAKELMNPGRACITCHSTTGGEAPDFLFGGTVFATGHEPDLCKGGPQSSDTAQVVITDANGVVHTATANAVGNFFLERQDVADFAFPLTAKVVYQGRERVMGSAQDTGDCNSCHTQGGDNYAPGRITLP